MNNFNELFDQWICYDYMNHVLIYFSLDNFFDQRLYPLHFSFNNFLGISFISITSFNKNLRKCFSSEHTRFSLNAWLTLNLSMFRVWRNIMKILMCVALIKRSVASLMLENLTAISKNGALPLLNSCVDLILRCYFIDHLKMTPSFSSPHYPLRSRYTLSMCVTSSFQLFPPFTAILISFSWDVPVFNHLRWRVTKTSLDHHDFYFLPLPAPKSVQYTVNFASQVRTNTVCYTLTLNPVFSVSIDLEGSFCW